jgi:hypothetical protein
MRGSKIAALCVAAILALAAITTASAFASEPEYVACVKAAKSGKTYTGKYSDKACSEANVKAEGKYELGAPKLPAKLKGTVGKVDIYLYKPATKTVEGHFECSGGKEAGSMTSTREVTFSATWTSCKATGSLAGPCNSPSQKAGVVATESLVGKLVWLNEAETQAGLQIKPAAAGGAITKVVCAGGAETAELAGTMLASIAPTSGASKLQTISLTASATTGEPEYQGHWESGSFDEEPLYSNLKGLKEFEGVPTGLNGVFAQKGPAVLIA